MATQAQPVKTVPAAVNLPEGLAFELHKTSCAALYGLSCEHFTVILLSSARKAGISEHDATTLGEFCKSLKLEELALARGCGIGNDKAWEVFLNRYREKLYDAARRVTREDSSAHELADSLYADLYATGERDGKRISKLDHYHGRGSLEGWLRTVLAQEWVNRYRKNKRLVSLEQEEESGVQFASPVPANVTPSTTKLEAATDRALAKMPAEDRYILSAYFLDERNLKDIGKTLGVHESTISRKVEKLGKTVRKNILEELQRGGMSRRQAEEELDTDVRDLALDVRRSLAVEAQPPPE